MVLFAIPIAEILCSVIEDNYTKKSSPKPMILVANVFDLVAYLAIEIKLHITSEPPQHSYFDPLDTPP